jgi:hypothetical protein
MIPNNFSNPPQLHQKPANPFPSNINPMNTQNVEGYQVYVGDLSPAVNNPLLL